MIDRMHDLTEIFMMSLAIGMDAFSLAIGIGLNGLTRDQAISMCVSIGFFHILMTLIGINAGLLMHGVMGQIAKWFGAFLLFTMGVHMAYSSLFRREDAVSVGPSAHALLLFSAGVSVDALSVGFSLGLRSTGYGLVSAGAFGLVSTVMCGFGLILGRRAGRIVGLYGELLGAGILIGYGIHFLVR